MGRLEGFLQQALDRHHPRDESGTLGFMGVHLAPGQAHFHGLGLAEGAGQALGAANGG